MKKKKIQSSFFEEYLLLHGYFWVIISCRWEHFFINYLVSEWFQNFRLKIVLCSFVLSPEKYCKTSLPQKYYGGLKESFIMFSETSRPSHHFLRDDKTACKNLDLAFFLKNCFVKVCGRMGQKLTNKTFGKPHCIVGTPPGG